MSANSVVRLIDVSFSYPGTIARQVSQVLAGISMELVPGRITVIVGPSGCGKTTLLNVIAGLLTPDTGRLERPSASQERFRTGYVFQTPSLIPWRTIEDNAKYGARISGAIRERTNTRAVELLRAYGLGGYELEYPRRLSGGMQQRVAIVRAVVSDARIIALDEPFSNSDFTLRHSLAKDLSIAVDTEKLIAVFVTHDLEEAVKVGDRIYVLSRRPATVVKSIDVPIPRVDRLRSKWFLTNDLRPYFEALYEVFQQAEY